MVALLSSLTTDSGSTQPRPFARHTKVAAQGGTECCKQCACASKRIAHPHPPLPLPCLAQGAGRSRCSQRCCCWRARRAAAATPAPQLLPPARAQRRAQRWALQASRCAPTATSCWPSCTTRVRAVRVRRAERAQRQSPDARVASRAPALAAECRQCCAAEGGGDEAVGPFTSAALEVDSWRLRRACVHAASPCLRLRADVSVSR